MRSVPHGVLEDVVVAADRLAQSVLRAVDRGVPVTTIRVPSRLCGIQCRVPMIDVAPGPVECCCHRVLHFLHGPHPDGEHSIGHQVSPVGPHCAVHIQARGSIDQWLTGWSFIGWRAGSAVGQSSTSEKQSDSLLSHASSSPPVLGVPASSGRRRHPRTRRTLDLPHTLPHMNVLASLTDLIL